MSKIYLAVLTIVFCGGSASFAQDSTFSGSYASVDPFSVSPSGLRFGAVATDVSVRTASIEGGGYAGPSGNCGGGGCQSCASCPGGFCADWKLVPWYASWTCGWGGRPDRCAGNW